jgi:hypothetical protein
MTSTAPLPIPADPAVPSAPSLSLAPAPDRSDSSAPAASRPRFRRLVVFTGQLS